jgi:uncharacterized membrane protein
VAPVLLKALLVYLFFALTWQFFRAVFHVAFIILVIAAGLWAWHRYGALVMQGISRVLASSSSAAAPALPPRPPIPPHH